MKLPLRKTLENIKIYEAGIPMEDIKRKYGLARVDKLSTNENPLNCSPKVIESVIKAASNLSLYPDGNSTELRKAIAKFYGVDKDEIIVTNGLDEMITILTMAFLDAGDETIIPDNTFSSYTIAAQIADANIKTVPIKNFKLDLDGIAKAIGDNTKLIWLCNPNNPTGTIFTEAEFFHFMSRVPKDTVVLYDEAYAEFVTDSDYPKDSFKLYKKYPNMVIMRTFSKVYGLAGLRVGYSFANKALLQSINKVRNVFNVNKLAQIAATVALDDQDFVKEVIAVNNEGKEYLYKSFDAMGITYIPSETNYILLDTGKDCGEVFESMQRQGVIIRPIRGTFIRVTIGTMDQNERFIGALKKVLAK